MKKSFVIPALVALALSGCDSGSRSESESVVSVTGEVAQVQLPLTEDSVLIRVGGDSLTLGELESFATIRGSVRSVFTGLSSGTAAANKRLALMKSRARVFPGARLLVRESLRRGLTYSTNDFARVLKNYRNLAAADEEVVRRLIEEDLRIAALRKDILSTVRAVDDEKLKKCVERIAAYNEMAVATNSEIIAELNAVRERVISGRETFEEVARRFSEDDWVGEMGCEWGRFRADELIDEEEIVKALKEMKPHDISPVVAGDGGYLVVRLDDFSDGAYTLSRIFRRRVAMMDVETTDQLRDRFRAETCEKQLRELVNRLLRENPPEYPLGTNFMDKVKGAK